MTTKTKLAKPKNSAVARTTAAKLLTGLTDLDREEAFEIIKSRWPQLMDLEAREDPCNGLRIKQQLHTNRLWKFHFNQPGEVQITTCDEGLDVSREDRRGVVTWLELAGEASAGEPDEPDMSGVLSTATPGGITALDPAAIKKPRPGDVPANRGIELVELVLKSIDTSKNPRRHFDEAKLAELAESIQAHGILQPIVVNQLELKSGRYELVAGERRLRAAILAGITRTICRVMRVTAQEAAELRLLENLQREDLNAIEEALGFEALVQEFGVTHDALAARLGCSQGHVTNRIRLLRLPPAWQAKIISREIPPTHARVVARYAEYPAILQEIQKALRNGVAADYRSFERDVERAAAQATRPLSGETYHQDLWKIDGCHSPWAKIPKFSEEQLAELQPIKIGKESRATNVALFDRLFVAAAKERIAKRSKAGSAKTKAGSEPTPADKKASAKKQADSLKTWIRNWRSDWLRRILSERVVDDQGFAMRVVVMAIAHGSGIDQQNQRIEELVEPRTPGLKRERAIAGDTDAGAIDVLMVLAGDWLWSDDQAAKDPGSWHGRRLDEDSVEALAEVAGVDLKKCWVSDGAGEPWTEAFFLRHTTAGLIALAKELGVKTTSKTKADLVQALLMAPETYRRLPKAIALVNKPKKKTARAR